MINSYSFGKPGLYYQKCMYLETSRHISNRLFKEKGLRVKITKEDFNSGDVYGIVWCKVRKVDMDKFKEAMKELDRNMAILGDTYYEKFCRDVYNVCKDNGILTGL